MAKNTDPVQMLTDIANGFDTIAASIKKIKLPKKSPALKQMQLQTINLVNQNKKLVDELRVLRREFEVLRTVAIKYGTDASNAENKVERTAKKTADAAKKRREEYNKANKQSSGYFNSMLGAAKQQIAWYPTKALTLGFLQAMRSIPQVTAEYEQALRDISSVSRMADTDLANLSETIKEVGTTTKYSLIEVAKAGKILAQSGLRGEELSGALQPLAEMAAATSATLESAARLQTTVMRAYSMSTDQFNEISDSVVNAVASTRLSLEDLNVAFSYTASAAQQTGVSFTETITLLGLLRNAGLEASTAATGLRMALLKITAPTRKAQKVLDVVGLSKKDLDIANKGIFEVLKSLNKLSKKSIIDIFGARSANAMLVFKNISMDTAKALEDLIKIQGTAKFTAAAQMDTVQGQWKLLFDNLKSSAIDFGSVFQESITEALKSLITTIQVLQSVAHTFSSSLSFMVKSLAGLASATIGIKLITSAFTQLKKVTLVAAEAISAFYIKIMALENVTVAANITKMVSSLKYLAVTLSPVLILIGGVTAAITYEAYELNKLTSNIKEASQSYTKLAASISESVLKLNELKDLDIGKPFESAMVQGQKPILTQNLNKYYESLLKLELTPDERQRLNKAWKEDLASITNLETLEDLKNFDNSMNNQDKNFRVMVAKHRDIRAKIVKDASKNGVVLYQDNFRTFSVEQDKQIKAYDKALEEIDGRIGKFVDIKDIPAFKSAIQLSNMVNADLKQATKYNHGVADILQQNLVDRKIYQKGIEALDARRIKLGNKLTKEQDAALTADKKRLQANLKLSDNWKDHINLSPEQLTAANKRGLTLGDQINKNLVKDLKTNLLGASSQKQKDKIISDYVATFPESFDKERKRLLEEEGLNVENWASSTNSSKEAGKTQAQLLIYGISTKGLKEQSAVMTAEINALRSQIYADGIVSKEEYGQQATLIEKTYDKAMLTNQINFNNNLKAEMDKGKVNKIKAFQDDQALNEKAASENKTNFSHIEQMLTDYKTFEKSLNIGSKEGVAKLDSLNISRQALTKLIDDIRYSDEFDPESAKFVKLLKYVIDLASKLGLQINKTDQDILKSEIQTYASQISTLTKLRDNLSELGQTERVHDLNAKILQIYEKQLKVRKTSIDQSKLSPEMKAIKLKDLKVEKDLFVRALHPEIAKAEEYFQSFKDGVTSDFSGFLESLVEGTKSVGEAFKDLGRSILKTFTDIIAKNLAEQLFDSLFKSSSSDSSMIMGFFKLISSWAGAGQAHNGMTVSSVTPRNKHVNPLIFANAPRLHDGYNLPGLRQSEFPAILEQGETVLPKNYQATNQAPSVTINMENKSSQKIKMKTSSTQFDGEEYIINTIITDAANNGAMRQVL